MNAVFFSDFTRNQTAGANFGKYCLVCHADHLGCFLGAVGDAGDLRMCFHLEDGVSFEISGRWFEEVIAYKMVLLWSTAFFE